ncbi:MAG TPA: tetratricopeptide repeat protein [Phycisphaerae bacterium]|nr:tetratricopeptide repeat protein [Phycisphaerae bacterium]
MPSLPPQSTPARRSYLGCQSALAILVGFMAGAAVSAAEPQAVRAQRIEVHYRLVESSPGVEIVLWYTRDRGATWQKYGIDSDGRSPLVFIAPAEGLYGLSIVNGDQEPSSTPSPKSFGQPQRWVFVDYTPPLGQWQGVEPCDDFASDRTVQLRWTAHDDNLEARPISLSWQSSIDQQWKPIASELPNTGRYDWPVPAEAAGQITLKLTVRDRGGHAVERLYGPVPLIAWRSSVSTRATVEPENAKASTRPAATMPALAAATRPAPVETEARRKAEERYRQGSMHLLSGRYALAAERFKEALDLDPGLLAAMNDLAGTYYFMEDYEQSARLYLDVLERDPGYQASLRGAALAYGARRQYPQARDMLTRLLAVNEKDAESLLDLGDVLFRMGDRDGARQHWQRAMAADASKTEIISKARKRLDSWPTTSGNSPAVAAGHRE